MDALKRQYSQEHLLFIIEISLYQRAIYEHIHLNKFQPQYKAQNIDTHALKQMFLKLPSACPKSSIVEEDYENVIQTYGELVKTTPTQILSYGQRKNSNI